MDLKERTRWAISFVAKKKKLSNPKIGKIIGIKADTVNSYRSKLANPKVDFIIKFCDAFDIDILWFTKGEGEPFPGANLQFPEICSPSRYETQKQGGIQDLSDIEPPVPLPPSRENHNFETNIVINLTEKSLANLCKLIGIPIVRGWKSALAGFLEITPAQLSNAISRDRISKNLLIKIEEKGYRTEHWLTRQARKASRSEHLSDNYLDAEMSLQKLALLIGIKIDNDWVFNLAEMIGTKPRHLHMSIQKDHIDEDLVYTIETMGYERSVWAVKKESAPPLQKRGRFPGDTVALLRMAETVLYSGTSHATALAMNIVSLDAAVSAEQKLKDQSIK